MPEKAVSTGAVATVHAIRQCVSMLRETSGSSSGVRVQQVPAPGGSRVLSRRPRRSLGSAVKPGASARTASAKCSSATAAALASRRWLRTSAAQRQDLERV